MNDKGYERFDGHSAETRPKKVAARLPGPPFPLLLLGVCNGASHKPQYKNAL